jgi:threonine dehydratase
MTNTTITLADVQAAARRIASGVSHTPCLQSRTLSGILGCEVWLKFENLQFTASFKERGALNKLLQLTAEERSRGVVAMSAGNHAQGVAYHAHRLGIPATIVMPRATPFIKVRNTRAHGARVILFGDTLAEAAAHAEAVRARESLVFVHPYDDAAIIAGQGTIALEMLSDVPALDTLCIPVGGGGMIAGMAVAGKALKPGIQIIGVESQFYDAMRQTLAGAAIQVGGETIAEGIAVRDVGALAVGLARQYVDNIVTVSEESLERAIVMLLEIEKTVTEGAGAAGLAALIQYRELFAGKKVGLRRDHRLIRLRVGIPDSAGNLAKLLVVVGDAGANLIDVFHQRVFAHVSAKRTEVELTLETRDQQHVGEVLAALSAHGFNAEQLDDDGTD